MKRSAFRRILALSISGLVLVLIPFPAAAGPPGFDDLQAPGGDRPAEIKPVSEPIPECEGQDANSGPAGADLTGLQKFLELAAVLEKDQEPDPEMWDGLFATPGYAVLLQREFQKDFFRERFRLAFMPSRAADLQDQINKETGLRAKILPHYVRAKAMRSAIERWAAEQRPAELYAQAIEKAKALLPEGAVSGRPAVSLVIFAPDSRGYDPVVLDALYCMDKGGSLVDLVAHEFHHYYRNRLVDLDQDQATLWVINQIHAEGIADLIDKAGWVRGTEADLTPEAKSFAALYRKSPDVLQAMDGLLARMGEVKTGRGTLGNELRRAVPQAGHPTGLYMAMVIQEELGTKALVCVADDPFAFFRLYQDAAGKRNGDAPRFSAQAMAFLDMLARGR
jgi:hypothetical protein